MGEMRSEMTGIAMMIAEKTLSQPLPEEVHRKKFQDILDGFRRAHAGARHERRSLRP